MGIRIKHDSADFLEERFERLTGDRTAPDLADALMQIGRTCAALPDLDDRDAAEILGYNENGAFRHPLSSSSAPVA